MAGKKLPPLKKGEEKHPLLRCPICGYTYRPVMAGWAFRTDINTKCIGKEADPTQHFGGHAFHHPFVVDED